MPYDRAKLRSDGNNARQREPELNYLQASLILVAEQEPARCMMHCTACQQDSWACLAKCIYMLQSADRVRIFELGAQGVVWRICAGCTEWLRDGRRER